jgi:hypothetical protein
MKGMRVRPAVSRIITAKTRMSPLPLVLKGGI